MNCSFQNLGFYPADILLPEGVDMTKWSVIACDQYTSEPEYWDKVESTVGGNPSTLRLTMPEIYLGSGNVDERIEKINETMKDYRRRGLFRKVEDSMIYVERRLANGKIRKGLVGVVDLEDYDYNAGSSTLIRATEGTVLDRIPPRVRVREGAELEVPHVMLLADDPDHTVIEPVSDARDGLEKLYDFHLMQGGGSITGYRVEGERLSGIAGALKALARPEVFEAKYGAPGKPVLVYAAGDGNHSLATAKECYSRIKATLPPEQAKNHPARYALVELVNLHDSSLEFEPIHRVVFDVDPEKLLKAFFEAFPNARKGEGPGHRVEYLCASASGVITCEYPKSNLAVGMLQAFLDGYLKNNGGRVDYIHGEAAVKALSSEPGRIGFLLPPMGKSDLFKTVVFDGVLPRKTFSMGEADDKRYYLECRGIR